MNEKLYRPFRIYKIDAYFHNNIITKGKDPLELLFKLSDIGDLVESNTNVSQLPTLYDINPKSFYLAWTSILKTKSTESELREIFLPFKQIGKIIIEEYDEDYLTYTSDAMMGNKIGEVLIEKGLITEQEIREALKEQKRLGEILIDAGLITQQQIDNALKAQKKIGQILIESGKIVPSKILSIVEQQKQVRLYNRMNTIKVDIAKLDNLMTLINKITENQKEISKDISDSDSIAVDKLQEKLNYTTEKLTEIKRIIDKCRNAT